MKLSPLRINHPAKPPPIRTKRPKPWGWIFVFGLNIPAIILNSFALTTDTRGSIMFWFNCVVIIALIGATTRLITSMQRNKRVFGYPGRKYLCQSILQQHLASLGEEEFTLATELASVFYYSPALPCYRHCYIRQAEGWAEEQHLKDNDFRERLIKPLILAKLVYQGPTPLSQMPPGVYWLHHNFERALKEEGTRREKAAEQKRAAAKAFLSHPRKRKSPLAD